MVEHLFDVVECVIIFNNIGGTVIPNMSGGSGAGDEVEVVRSGEV